MSTLTHNSWMIVIVLMLISATVQMVSAETAHVANHVVISEFATRGSDSAYDEFVELYNPTSSAINIGGWKFRYWSGSSWEDKLAIPDGETIPSHGFYLVASKDYASSTEPDQRKDGNFGFADGSASNPRGIRIIDSGSTVVDTVVYGGAGGDDDPCDQAEGGKLAPNHKTTANDNSVERKAIASSEADDMAPSGVHHIWGNGEDTDNNGNDFVRQTNGREPQNSSSATEDCPAQSWFLHNDSAMYKENMSKPEGTATVSDGSSTVWRANEPAAVDVGFPAGTWTGTITLSEPFASDETFTVEVGSYEDSTFTSAGSQICTGAANKITFSLEIPATAFDISNGNYLALNITNPSDGSGDLVIKTGGGNSYVTSPSSDPAYPVPELATIILFSAGLLILAGYAYMGRRNK